MERGGCGGFGWVDGQSGWGGGDKVIEVEGGGFAHGVVMGGCDGVGREFCVRGCWARGLCVRVFLGGSKVYHDIEGQAGDIRQR